MLPFVYIIFGLRLLTSWKLLKLLDDTTYFNNISVKMTNFYIANCLDLALNVFFLLITWYAGKWQHFKQNNGDSRELLNFLSQHWLLQAWFRWNNSLVGETAISQCLKDHRGGSVKPQDRRQWGCSESCSVLQPHTTRGLCRGNPPPRLLCWVRLTAYRQSQKNEVNQNTSGRLYFFLFGEKKMLGIFFL